MVGQPEMYCEDTTTYDFASTLKDATTLIRSGGQDHEPRKGGTYQNIAVDGWAGWWQQALFFQGDVSGWLGRPTIFSLPVFSVYGKTGDIVSTWNLPESAVPAPFQGPNENKGLGGARAVGLRGARAPCPTDGQKHRIRFRLYARKGSSTSVRYVPDKTSGDDVHHELNLADATLAIAHDVVHADLDPNSCSTPYAMPPRT